MLSKCHVHFRNIGELRRLKSQIYCSISQHQVLFEQIFVINGFQRWYCARIQENIQKSAVEKQAFLGRSEEKRQRDLQWPQPALRQVFPRHNQFQRYRHFKQVVRNVFRIHKPIVRQDGHWTAQIKSGQCWRRRYRVFRIVDLWQRRTGILLKSLDKEPQVNQ